MPEYAFETIHCDAASGYSLFGGVGLSTEGHREAILRRAAPVPQQGSSRLVVTPSGKSMPLVMSFTWSGSVG